VQLLAVEAGQVFLAPVTVGGQSFNVVVDTGSSDPWLVLPDFTCYNPADGSLQDQTDCNFGPAYVPSSSSSYEAIPNMNFNITYADHEYLNGDLAYDTFAMGGITVPRQQFATVDYAAWYGDGYSSGLIGFAYSTLTSAYNGSDPNQDRRGATIMYNTLFTNMYNLSLVPPVFSLAIDRDPQDGGLLALGGIPDIPVSPRWVSTPIQRVGIFPGTNTPAYEFYTIETEGFAFSASQTQQFSTSSTSNPNKQSVGPAQTVIVDSGTSLVYAPNSVAASVANSFSPPGNYDTNIDAYLVPCGAIPPVFGVSIEGKIFFVNPADLIIPISQTHCISAVQPNNGGLTILGDAWMKNVLSVFDVGAARMRFAARQYYGLTRSPVYVTT
jgi:hypothetical protein